METKTALKFLNDRNYNLLRELVITEFKLRYQGSALGYLWSLAKPLMLFGVLYVVFTQFLPFGKSVPYYPVYLLLGIVLWTYFVEATTGGLGSIVGRGDLLRKISFPKYIIVLSTSASAFVNLLLNLVVVAIFMAFMRVPLTPQILLLPLLLIELFIIATSFAFLLSAMFVRFRDISYIWEVVLQIMFYATPIIYPLTIVPHRYAQILSLNPLAQIIQDARYITVTHVTLRPADLLPPVALAVVTVITVLFVALSALYFRKHSKNFAEDI